ncbi:MAG: UDP-N-acetylmuramoyl-L-alanyl-D-glutamate--2,6-diaminopimelate ligase [Phycisphaeraceae bacterium]
MRLDELITDLPVTLVQGDPSLEITDITDDSRTATPGCLFIARGGGGGGGEDASRYIADAIGRGAAAVLRGQESAVPNQKSEIRHQTSAPALLTAPAVDQALAGRLAERFFGFPSRKLKVIAITGTNGKTTTAFIVQHLLQQAGVRCGLIGTVTNDDGRVRTVAELTTPGAIGFIRLLAMMVQNGCEAVVAETSSHALHQGRIAAINVDVAVFTNLTRDHLDYHQTMERYADAKAMLFEQLAPGAWAVVNGDDASADRMLRDCKGHMIRCSVKEGADAEVNRCRARIITLAADHSRVQLDGPWGSIDVKLPMAGKHNVYNALQAAAAANCITPLSRILRKAMAQCPAPPGRLEQVRADWGAGGSEGQGPGAKGQGEAPTVFVDYAHTHDALKNVLKALRPVCRGRLITLFGCGGDRDATKRPLMAAEACALSDVVIITSDNPRTEDPRMILEGILKGVPDHKFDEVIIEPDRALAIQRAIRAAMPEDIVLIAGKGHEDYQIIGREKRHFDDREHAAAALQAWQGQSTVGAA